MTQEFQIGKFSLSTVILFCALLSTSAATHYVDLNSSNPSSPYSAWAMAATNIQDAINSSIPGDLVLVTNGVYQNARETFSDPVTQVYGECRIVIPNGVTVASVNGPSVTAIQGGRPYLCCACLESNATLSGFMLTNGVGSFISSGGSLGGGVYCLTTNCWITNCIICSNSASAGGGVYLGTLINCIISNNVAAGLSFQNMRYSGGGACGSVLNHCILIGNAANQGGGAYNCTVNDSTLINNSATNGNFAAGGAACGGILNNCIVVSNSASYGLSFVIGGAICSNVVNNSLIIYNQTGPNAACAAVGCIMTNCTIAQNIPYPYSDVVPVVLSSVLRNCILYYNGFQDLNYPSDLENCCAERGYSYFPFSGDTNNDFTDAPLFVNTNSDFHLLSNSPCINSGLNHYAGAAVDLDGNPRIVGGTVDVGAYEYQSPASIISYAWLQHFGLPTDGSADQADLDGTAFNVYQDWIAGLNPTNPASVLALSSVASTNNPSGIAVSWQSVNNRTYSLQRSVGLTVQPSFSTIQSNLVGHALVTTYIDTTATNIGPYFYRVGVQ